MVPRQMHARAVAALVHCGLWPTWSVLRSWFGPGCDSEQWAVARKRINTLQAEAAGQRCCARDVACLKPGGGGVPALRRARLFRMAFEAVEQGARLSQEDFVRLLGIDVRTVRRIVREFRQQGVFLPTRGYSQDIGRGTSHKAVAVRMYLQYATYGEMERRTSDSAASLIRYLKDFGKVVQALSMAVPQHQIAPLTGLSARLVAEYVALYRQYDRPEHQGVLERIRHPLAPAAEKGGRR